MSTSRRARAAAGASAAALVLGVGVVAGTAAPADAAPAAAAKVTYDRTSATERKRVDRVPTPRLRWWDCSLTKTFGCTTVKLPRDYDHPKGAKVELTLVRYPARDQKRKIGTLFVNPGGPGGEGTAIAQNAPLVFSPDLLERFDVVGFDPRGVGDSANVECFSRPSSQQAVLRTLYATPFPLTARREAAFVRAYQAEGKGCSTTGRPLSASMSTAEVARDMDVLRRAVGDRRLSYVGFSYGTYLGQVYANLFPDRVRALVLDGVLDPEAWRGSTKTRNTPVTDRIASAPGATRALIQALRLCDRAGETRCPYAAGDPVRRFDALAQRLKTRPIAQEDPLSGETFRFGYSELVGTVGAILYFPDAPDFLALFLDSVDELANPAPTAAAAAARTQALRRVQAELQRIKERTKPLPSAKVRAFDVPYDNEVDAFSAVLCTDSLNPADVGRWPAYADAADKKAKWFGRSRSWQSAACGSRTWTAKDEDAYRGTFRRRTVNPLLFVGNYWDPATNYDSARTADALAPNSRLLRSDNWGHTAYDTSDCATDNIDRYLLSLRLPSSTTFCRGEYVPFTEEEDDEDVSDERLALQRALAPLGPTRLPG